MYDIPQNIQTDISNQDNIPWYAIRVLTHKQESIAKYFNDKDLETFIPMAYIDYLDKEKHLRRAFRPVIHNLVFVKKTKEEPDMRIMFNNTPYPISVIRKNDTQCDYYKIPAKQMFEFITMCNVITGDVKYMDEDSAKLKTGVDVQVKFGPMKGLSGKLVRQSKKYYLLKEIPGIAVMVKISKWCCVPVEEQ